MVNPPDGKKVGTNRRRDEAEGFEAAAEEVGGETDASSSSSSSDDDDSFFETKRVTVSVPLHPSKLCSAASGVADLLESKRLRHHDGFGGVPTKYERVDVKLHDDDDDDDDACEILEHSGYVVVKAEVDATVFKPRVGGRVVGIVNKIGCDHVGLIVGGIFNASIPVKNMKEDVVFDENGDRWEILDRYSDDDDNGDDDEENDDDDDDDGKAGKKRRKKNKTTKKKNKKRKKSFFAKEIKVGAKLKFEVERVNREDDRVVLLIGSLLSKGTGPIDDDEDEEEGEAG